MTSRRRTLARLLGGIACVLLLVPLALPAQAVAPGDAVVVEPVAVGGSFELLCSASFSENDLTFGELRGYDTISLGPQCERMYESGRPMLPQQTIRVALPAGMAVTGVRVIDTTDTEIPGDYRVFPAQPPRRVSDVGPLDFAAPDPEVYSSPTAWPGKLVEFAQQTDLAGQALALVVLYPVQYVPARHKLVLHTSITFALEGVDGYECGDYLPAHLSTRARTELERAVREEVVNPADVELRPLADPPMRERGVAPDEREYVIITKADWIDDFQPLADWKTRKGTRAVVVDRDWIYSTYSAANEPAKIRAFVHDAYDTWGTVYFLLGGDTNTIPFHTKNINNEDVPNDTYYSDFDGDWTCEVNVGRASVRGTAAISDFINKVLTYEQNPPPSDYAKTALFLGFDLYELGSNEGESCKEHIRNTHIPPDWTYRSEYDSEPGGHHDDAIAYLNQGNNLVNHIDHCATDVMGVGCVNHDEYLFNTDMNNLTNGDRQSILYSIGCWPCDYPDYTCIAESFVRNVGGGGVAFIGNSRSGYYTAYGDDGFSLRYDRFFFRQLFMFDYYHLGSCFSRHKNQAYQHDPIMMYVFTELTLLGDPELPIWTDDPQTLAVGHDAVFPLGAAGFTVHVADAAGEDVQGATVCLWKGDEVYLVAATDTAGDASFAPSPTTAGTMLVTVTGRNDQPYLGSAEVGYVLAVDLVGNGWVERFPDKPVYSQDEPVALIAHADPGWAFARWSGDLSGSANPAVLTMSAHRSVTAHFVATPPTDCPEDLVVDGQIGLEDLSELLGAYGAQPGDYNWNPNADFDGDDVIGLSDLSQILSVYGQDCPTR